MESVEQNFVDNSDHNVIYWCIYSALENKVTMVE